MRGIVSVTLTSILSHTGRGGQGRCFEIVSKCSAVERDPDKLSGTWVFGGTRVPVSALFENLKDDATVAQFLEWFPGVDGRNVDAVLAHEMESLANVMDS